MTTEAFEQAKREKIIGLIKFLTSVGDVRGWINEPSDALIREVNSDLTALLEQHKEMILREELIEYDHWAARQLIGSSEVLTAEQAVDAYLEELKNVKK